MFAEDLCCMVATQNDTIIGFKKSEHLIFNSEDEKAFVKVLVKQSGEIKSREPMRELKLSPPGIVVFRIQAKDSTCRCGKLCWDES